MNLYRKHRPEDFSEVRGNEEAVAALAAQFEKPDHAHCFLFYGPSGCGKTTLARIVAKTVLGASDLSIHEINSSDNRGIDTARDLQDKMRFRSSDGAPTVFIIDEVHQTTKDWQNAMLKPLEDTPEHVYFMLCTTEPGKLIKALHTRLTTVEVKPLTEEELIKLAMKVAKKEGWTIPKEAYEKMASEAGGSPRQMLVFLEKIGSLDSVEDMLKNIASAEAVEVEGIALCRALLSNRPWKELSGILQGLKNEEPEKLRRAVLGYMNSVLLNSGKHNAGIIMQAFSENTYDSGFPGLVLMAFTAHSELNT
jgi:DNA polymerase-3 subunit gamma/tau